MPTMANDEGPAHDHDGLLGPGGQGETQDSPQLAVPWTQRRSVRVAGVVLAGLAALVVLAALLVVALWLVPEQLNRREFATPAERATAVNAARIPAAAVFAAAVAGIGVWVSHRGVVIARDTLKQTSTRDSETTRLTQAGQYTDRYIKAIQLISDDKLNARLGGLYALEQLAREAPKTYHATIVDVLAAYVRDRAPWPPRPVSDPPTSTVLPRSQRRAGHRRPGVFTAQEGQQVVAIDVQAVLTILGRRATTHDGENLEDHPLNLASTDLRFTDLAGAQLQGADLAGAQLQGAELYDARMQDAHLAGAQLQRANLMGAELQRASLELAQLPNANLVTANLEGANLHGAHLQDARLSRAQLQRAYMVRAQMQGANLYKAALLTHV